jgi:hypothetical protein
MSAQDHFSFQKNKLFFFWSNASFQILQTNQTFTILAPPNIPGELIISCFDEIFSLFSVKSEIIISQTNVLTFQYLAEVFENATLSSICQNVVSTGKRQEFYFTSEQFRQFSKDFFNSLKNFRIKLIDSDIECNNIFAALISNKIIRQIEKSPNNSSIDFSDYPDSKAIKIVFGILEGSIIEINETNSGQILNA